VRAVLSKTFRSLTVRNYRLFATGQLIKLLGVWMMFTAQDWLVLDLSHNSPGALGSVAALQFVPVLLLTRGGGAVAGEVRRRRGGDVLREAGRRRRGVASLSSHRR